MNRSGGKYSLLILLHIAFCLFFCGQSVYSQNDVKPLETLVWTYADLNDLKENAADWHNRRGIDGFIFCFINKKNGGPPRIDDGRQRIETIYSDLKPAVDIMKSSGITANFVHANLDDPKWTWKDKKRVAKLPETFAALARVAKSSGCRGVALDLEAYSTTLWDPSKYPDKDYKSIQKLIYNTGVMVMKSILKEFPDSEILVLPEGAYIDLMNSPGGYRIYEWYMDFFNGLASQKPKKGIVVLTECGYYWSDPVNIARMHGALSAAMTLESDDPIYLLSKCSIAHGVDLNLKTGAKINRTPEQFATQWETMGKLSQCYRFIFAGECGLTVYPSGVDAYGIKAFAEPLVDNADDYFAVIRKTAGK